jgi:hypothetical protein
MAASVSELASILKNAGLKVVVGLAGQGESGEFNPIGLIFHHDGVGLSYVDSWRGKDNLNVAKNMSVKGTNGAQFWVGRSGTWYILSAGKKWHAGAGGPYGNIGRSSGNARSYGIETDYGPVRAGWTGKTVIYEGHSWPVWDNQHIDSVYEGSAALAKELGLNTFCGHKEYAPGRKIDPANVDLNDWRKYIINPPAPTPAPTPTPPEDDVTPQDIDAIANAVVKKLQGTAVPDFNDPAHPGEPVKVSFWNLLPKLGNWAAVTNDNVNKLVDKK